MSPQDAKLGATEPVTAAPDWTADETGRSNSSETFVRLVDEIERLIRSEAFSLINGNVSGAARLILAQLAHVHGLVPVREVAALPEGRETVLRRLYVANAYIETTANTIGKLYPETLSSDQLHALLTAASKARNEIELTIRALSATPEVPVDRETFDEAVGHVLSEHVWYNDGKDQFDQRCVCNLWHGADWTGWRDHFIAVLAARLAPAATDDATAAGDGSDAT